jgi:aspartyl-tRNA(Asn)/glutamyl-tRNA(Gln) amidotransferase subunit C
MAITEKEVQYIAHLARLSMNAADLTHYAKDLSNILDLAAQMNAIDTQNIQPMAHPLAITQRLRPDAVTETDQRELFQKIAPQVESGLYLVPQVIE